MIKLAIKKVYYFIKDIIKKRTFEKELKILSRKSNFDNTQNIVKFHYENKDISIKIPDLGDFISFNICKHENFFDIHDLEILNRFIPNKAVIIDAGANIGNHSIYFSKILNAKKIFAFEPQKNIYNILCENIILNNISHIVKPFKIGLSHKSIKASVDFRDDINISRTFQQINHGGLYLKENSEGTFQLDSLDTLLFEELEQLDFIKLDIQGFEENALRGSQKIIQKFKPIIQVECMTKEELNESIIPLMKLLNYRLIFVMNTDYIFESIL